MTAFVRVGAVGAVVLVVGGVVGLALGAPLFVALGVVALGGVLTLPAVHIIERSRRKRRRYLVEPMQAQLAAGRQAVGALR